MKRRIINRLKGRVLLISLIVGLGVIFVFRGIPLLILLFRSFFANSPDNNGFTGLSNYFLVLKDEVFWGSLCNSFIVLLYIPVLLFFSLLTAMLIHNGFKFSGLYKTIIVFPQVVATMIIASIFSSIFGYNGPLNMLLNFFNVFPFYWLGTKVSAFLVIILCINYVMFGWQTLIFSGALSTVDPNIGALIKIDGVGFFRKISIYAHSIKNTILFSFVLNVVYGIAGFFPVIYTLTKGGPGYQTTTIDYLIYLRSFKYGTDLSSAYTVASLLFVIMSVIIGLLYVMVERRNDYV